VRVAQPPDQSSNAENPEGMADRGRLFFGYFILAKQKKVTSCRATPGGFGFALLLGATILRQAQGERPLKLRQIHHRLEPQLALHTLRTEARFALVGVRPDMHAHQSVLAGYFQLLAGIAQFSTHLPQETFRGFL